MVFRQCGELNGGDVMATIQLNHPLSEGLGSGGLYLTSTPIVALIMFSYAAVSHPVWESHLVSAPIAKFLAKSCSHFSRMLRIFWHVPVDFA